MHNHYRTAIQQRIIQSTEGQKITWDFQMALDYIEARGKSMYGPTFKVYSEDYEMIFKLIAYAIQDIEACKKYSINPSKGLLLTGPIGCGKTSLMTILNDFMHPDHRYIVHPCSQVSFQYAELGVEIIGRYAYRSFKTQPGKRTPKHYCFDDLGTETNAVHFGMSVNVMTEILLARHRLFHAEQMMTHVTTNLSADEIEARYGLRTRSRMRETFNLLAFDPHTPDKRQMQ